jgi:hypothetical protein
VLPSPSGELNSIPLNYNEKSELKREYGKLAKKARRRTIESIPLRGDSLLKKVDTVSGKDSNLSVWPVGAVSNMIVWNPNESTFFMRTAKLSASSMPGTEPIMLLRKLLTSSRAVERTFPFPIPTSCNGNKVKKLR